MYSLVKLVRNVVLATCLIAPSVSLAARPSLTQARAHVLAALRQNARTKQFGPWEKKNVSLGLRAYGTPNKVAFSASSVRDIILPFEKDGRLGGMKVHTGTVVSGTVRLTPKSGKRVTIKNVAAVR